MTGLHRELSTDQVRRVCGLAAWDAASHVQPREFGRMIGRIGHNLRRGVRRVVPPRASSATRHCFATNSTASASTRWRQCCDAASPESVCSSRYEGGCEDCLESCTLPVATGAFCQGRARAKQVSKVQQKRYSEPERRKATFPRCACLPNAARQARYVGSKRLRLAIFPALSATGNTHYRRCQRVSRRTLSLACIPGLLL